MIGSSHGRSDRQWCVAVPASMSMRKRDSFMRGKLSVPLGEQMSVKYSVNLSQVHVSKTILPSASSKPFT